MPTPFRLVCGAFLVALSFVPLGAQGDGFKPLFDGKTLNGWRGYKKPDTAGTFWKVENGIVTLPASKAGDTRGAKDIITDATYDQFDLKWEWKISEGGNSGLKYFVMEDETS